MKFRGKRVDMVDAMQILYGSSYSNNFQRYNDDMLVSLHTSPTRLFPAPPPLSPPFSLARTASHRGSASPCASATTRWTSCVKTRHKPPSGSWDYKVLHP